MSVGPYNSASRVLVRSQLRSSDDRGNSPLDDLQRTLDQMRLFSSPDGGESPAAGEQAVRQGDAKIANVVSGSLISFFEDLPIWAEKKRQVVVLRESFFTEDEAPTQQDWPSAVQGAQAVVPLATSVTGEGAVHRRVVTSYDDMKTALKEVSVCHSADEAYVSDPMCLEFEMLKVWTQHETSDTCRIQEVCFGIMIALQSIPQPYNFLGCGCLSCRYFQESMKSIMTMVVERCERPTDLVMDSELQKRDTGRLQWFYEKFLGVVDAHLPSSDHFLQSHRSKMLPFGEMLAEIIQRRNREAARHIGHGLAMDEVQMSREQQRFEMLKIWASREVQDTCQMQQGYFNILSAQKRAPFPRDLFNPIHPLFNRFNELMRRLKQLVDERRERLTDSVMDSVLQKYDTGRLRWFVANYSELVDEQFATSDAHDPDMRQIWAQVLAPRDSLEELLKKRTLQDPVE